MEPIAKIISKNVTSSINPAMTLEPVWMALATSHATAPELVLMAHDVKTTFWIARLDHATAKLVLTESIPLLVNATQVILAKNVNTNPALQICVNMVVLAVLRHMGINVIVLQALMVQIVRRRSIVSTFYQLSLAILCSIIHNACLIFMRPIYYFNT